MNNIVHNLRDAGEQYLYIGKTTEMNPSIYTKPDILNIVIREIRPHNINDIIRYFYRKEDWKIFDSINYIDKELLERLKNNLI